MLAASIHMLACVQLAAHILVYMRCERTYTETDTSSIRDTRVYVLVLELRCAALGKLLVYAALSYLCMRP